MAIKSIIDINVNDAAFDAFQKKFQAYQRALKSTPMDWKRIAQAQMGGKEGFRELVGEQVQAIGKAKIMAEVQKEAARITREQVSGWSQLNRLTKATASNVSNMTLNLARSLPVMTAISGLMGVGALWGVNRLAGNVSAGRQSSQGLDISYGGLKSFNNNYGRFFGGDAKGFLGGIGQARHSAEGIASLYGIGVTNLSGDTEDVAERAMIRLRQIAKTTNPQFYQNVLDATGASNLGVDYQTMNRLRKTGDTEFNKQLAAQRRDRTTLGLGGQDQLGWQNLETALNRSADTLEKIIVRGLAPLTPAIEKISDGFATALYKFLGTGDRSRMEKLGKDLEKFGDYLGDEKFQKDLDLFIKGIGTIASKIAEWVKWFGGGEGQAATPAQMYTGTPGAVGDPNAAITAAASARINSWFGVKAKPGAGTISPEMAAVAMRLQGIKGVGVVTAANDEHHKGIKSAHNEDRALDFRIDDISRAAEIIAQMRKSLADAGIKGRVIDETKPSGPNWTGPHAHVQVEVKNNTGGNAVIQTQQVAR